MSRRNGFAVKFSAATPSMLDSVGRRRGSARISQPVTRPRSGLRHQGHVPAKDIERLLAEEPDALGLTVPGMPVGSPGMEQGDKTEPYDVLLVKKDGTTEVFARH